MSNTPIEVDMDDELPVEDFYGEPRLMVLDYYSPVRRRTGAQQLQRVRRGRKHMARLNAALRALLDSPERAAFNERRAEWRINLRLMEAQDKRMAVGS